MPWTRRAAWTLLTASFALALPATAEAARVVYINTEPVTVNAGMTNDPAMDTVNVNNFMTTDFDGWTGATDEQKQALLALLKDVSVAFDIEFTLERPASGPYDMVVFGSADDHTSSFGDGCSTQVGLSDCGDANGVSIAFTYWGCLDAEDQLDVERVAFHTLGGLGYGWGLENLAGNGQVMAQWSNNAVEWGTMCTNLNGGGACMHAECDAGQQNSSADLIANIGARVDDGPPEVTVVSPAEGSDVDSPFDIVVEVDDAFGGIVTSLEIVDSGFPAVMDETFPYGWSEVALANGPTTLRVTATDADGNSTSVDVGVCVGGGCPDDPTGGTEEGGETEEGGGETTGAAAEEGGGGCSVAAGSTGAGGLAGLALIGLLGLRRRRSS